MTGQHHVAVAAQRRVKPTPIFLHVTCHPVNTSVPSENPDGNAGVKKNVSHYECHGEVQCLFRRLQESCLTLNFSQNQHSDVFVTPDLTGLESQPSER